MLLVLMFIISCDCCNKECDEGDHCPGQLDDDDDDTTNDDDDTGVIDDDDDDDDFQQSVIDFAEYVAGGTFSGAAMDMDPDGKPFLAAGKSRHLRLYEKVGALWEYDLVNFGQFANPSLAISPDGTFHLSYYDWYEGKLWYGWGTRGNWFSEVVDFDGDVGHYNSIVLDGAGKVHIAYTLESSRDPIGIRYATNKNGLWEVSTVESNPGVGAFPCIALDANSTPYITYNDKSPSSIKVARFYLGQWETIALDDSSPYNRSSSIAAQDDGTLHIAYRAIDGDQQVRYATGLFDSLAYSIVDAPGSVGDSMSLGLDLDNVVHIAYYDSATGDAMYANNEDKAWAITNLGHAYPVRIRATSTANVAISIGNFGMITNSSGLWETSRIDKGFNVDDCAIKTDADDNLHIAFLDRTNQALLYATNISNEWEIEVIATPIGGETRDVDIAVDSDGACHISYYDDTTFEIRYATNVSGAWETEVVDLDNVVGTHNSILVDRTDFVHISYYDETRGFLKYAHNMSGTWQSWTVDSGGICGAYSSIATHHEEDIHIAYQDISAGDVNLAVGNNGNWTVHVADDQSGTNISLALDHLASPHIAYYNSGLRVLRKDYSVWESQEVDPVAMESGISLAIGENEIVGISYQSLDWDLSYAYGKGDHWNTMIVDPVAQAGFNSSIVVGSSNVKYISYIAEGALWLARIE